MEEPFRVGNEFGSFQDFQTKLKQYEAEHKCLYIIRRNELDGDPNSVLKYKFVKFVCKHYGLKRENPNVTGERPRQKTYKIDCQAFFYLSKSAKKKVLVLRKFDETHNHACNDITVMGYPQSRRVAAESESKTVELKSLKVKPALIRPILRESESRIILGRDINNIWHKAKKKERGGRSEEEMLEAKLQEIVNLDPGAHCSVKTVENEVLYLLIQTSDMRKSLHKFPEVILTDITYKINKNMMPVSVIEVMDGEGQGEIVAYAFLANEQKETLTAMLEDFVQASGPDTFQQTACVLVDKDYAEIAAIRTTMPNAEVHLCSVHAERSFKEALKGEGNKKEVLTAMRGMLYSPDQATFDEFYEQFSEIASSKTKKYFDDNWLHLKEVWSLKDRVLVATLKNHTTNRVESHNQKLKMLFDVDTPLYDAIAGIVKILQGNRKDDRLYRNHESLCKRVYINKCSDANVNKICNDLTDFAAKALCQQLQLAKTPSPFPNKYDTDAESCSCIFFRTMLLPCRHIFRARKQNGLPLYSKEKVNKRWLREYNAEALQGTPPQLEQEGLPPAVPRMPGVAVERVLAPADKFKRVVPVTQRLNSLAVDCGTQRFHSRFQLLVDLAEAWAKGEHVALLHMGKTPAENCNEILEINDDVLEEPSSVNEKTSDDGKNEEPSDDGKNEEPSDDGKNEEPLDDGKNEEPSDDGKNEEPSTVNEEPSDDVIEKIVVGDCVKKKPSNCNTYSSDLEDLALDIKPPKQFLQTADTLFIDLVSSDEEIENSRPSLKQASFVLTAPPRIIGRPRGLGETVHDGTKKKENTKKRQDDHENDKGSTGFQLKVVKTKGRPKTTNSAAIKGKRKWNFNTLSDRSTYCCICDMEATGDFSLCAKCTNPVHSQFPCSFSNSPSSRVCNFCSEISQGSSKSPAAKSAKQYRCFTCGNTNLETKTIKAGKDSGRLYYACCSASCTRPKPFLFWAPKCDNSQYQSLLDEDTDCLLSIKEKSDDPHITSKSDPETNSAAPLCSCGNPCILAKRFGKLHYRCKSFDCNTFVAVRQTRQPDQAATCTPNKTNNSCVTKEPNTDACIVCQTEGPPQGAHKCALCLTPVHAFGCSVLRNSADQGEEGHGGTDRLCLQCAKNETEAEQAMLTRPKRQKVMMPQRYRTSYDFDSSF